MSRPPKPSHRLNLMAVQNWARSLSPNDRARWLANLVERERERAAGVPEASLPHFGEADELSRSGVAEAVAGDVASEAGRSSARNDMMTKPYRPSRSPVEPASEPSKAAMAEQELLQQDRQLMLEWEVGALVAQAIELERQSTQALAPKQEGQARKPEQASLALAAEQGAVAPKLEQESQTLAAEQGARAPKPEQQSPAPNAKQGAVAPKREQKSQALTAEQEAQLELEQVAQALAQALEEKED